eukprot:gnl/Carplike_NY0171/2024_a2727_558.p1 GENE.gnl/Carplike_NY0171/2024_a2727_558~~gnl/Carplike_NY0171/2024_a2727_558.p1  ORF type:complete len:906 (+),score=169.37 gnl/Carplike_NY0171/2024_a2727_558:90-2720(+)
MFKKVSLKKPPQQEEESIDEFVPHRFLPWLDDFYEYNLEAKKDIEGQGTFGKVIKATDKYFSGRKVALKFFTYIVKRDPDAKTSASDILENKGVPRTVLKDINLPKSVSHGNITRVVELTLTPEREERLLQEKDGFSSVSCPSMISNYYSNFKYLKRRHLHRVDDFLSKDECPDAPPKKFHHYVHERHQYGLKDDIIRKGQEFSHKMQEYNLKRVQIQSRISELKKRKEEFLSKKKKFPDTDKRDLEREEQKLRLLAHPSSDITLVFNKRIVKGSSSFPKPSSQQPHVELCLVSEYCQCSLAGLKAGGYLTIQRNRDIPLESAHEKEGKETKEESKVKEEELEDPEEIRQAMRQAKIKKMQKAFKHTSIALVQCILKQIVQALRYMHLRGLSHRDLKPHNILIDKNGVVKLCDLGISAVLYPKGMTGLRNIVRRSGGCNWDRSVPSKTSSAEYKFRFPELLEECIPSARKSELSELWEALGVWKKGQFSSEAPKKPTQVRQPKAVQKPRPESIISEPIPSASPSKPPSVIPPPPSTPPPQKLTYPKISSQPSEPTYLDHLSLIGCLTAMICGTYYRPPECIMGVISGIPGIQCIGGGVYPTSQHKISIPCELISTTGGRVDYDLSNDIWSLGIVFLDLLIQSTFIPRACSDDCGMLLYILAMFGHPKHSDWKPGEIMLEACAKSKKQKFYMPTDELLPTAKHIREHKRLRDLLEKMCVWDLFGEDKKKFHEDQAKSDSSGASSSKTKSNIHMSESDPYFVDEKTSNDCLDLLFRMLDLNPRRRPTCQEILDHPFLRDASDDPEIIKQCLPNEELSCHKFKDMPAWQMKFRSNAEKFLTNLYPRGKAIFKARKEILTGIVPGLPAGLAENLAKYKTQ